MSGENADSAKSFLRHILPSVRYSNFLFAASPTSPDLNAKTVHPMTDARHADGIKKMSQQNNNEKTSSPTLSGPTSDSIAASRLRIVTWKDGIEADFYIQAKGLHAGRPLEKPIANCWAVTTNIPHLRGIALSIYHSGLLKPFIIGSVVPFIRLGEYRQILTEASTHPEKYDDRLLQTIELLTDQIGHFQTKITLFQEFRVMLAASLNTHIQKIRP